MPSLDTFWECATKKDEKPNYVRFEETINGNRTVRNQFNMDKIDDWDKLILHVKGESVHSIQFKVIDVNRRDAWDKVKDFLGGIIEAVIGKIKGVIPKDSPLPLSGSLGGAADDLNSFLLKKLAGGNDVLFRGSTPLKDLEDAEGEGKFNINRRGTDGNYCIEFELTKDGQKQKQKSPTAKGSAATPDSGGPSDSP